MPNYSKKIVYLSKAQYQELITNNSVTVNGVTVTYNENDIYVTPQAEPITDVKINNTSIGNNGIVNIPIANSSTLGVSKINNSYGIDISVNGELTIKSAGNYSLKTGQNSFNPITPDKQHLSVFYGLATAAGDSSQSSSANEVGIYTDAAKGAIQNMLGITDLISTEETSPASKSHSINSIFIMDGKLCRATAAITIGDAVVIGTNCVQTTIDEVLPHDIQINGNSIVSNGIATIPVRGNIVSGSNDLVTSNAVNSALTVMFGTTSTQIKEGTHTFRALTPAKQHEVTFYGLAKAAGDTTQSSSDNAVGTYTDSAKIAIQTMLGVEPGVTLIETVSGTTPTITALPNVRYNCGEVSTISITPPANGTCDVFFTSGSTAAVLTVPNTVKWPAWFDATALETYMIYEIMITDGVYGSVMTWES